MDKQEAIDFVLDELDKGRSLPEITAALSRRLGAPVDLVSKFVVQTARRYQQSQAASGTPPASVGQPPASGPKPLAISREPSAFSQPPAAVSHEPLPVSREPLTSSQMPSDYSPQPVAFLGQTAASMAAAQEALPLPAAVSEPVAEQTPAPSEREAANSPELEKFILDELGRNKRAGDVALGVVERTGMEYRQAQRLVSRVGAMNYKKVTSRQNCVIIPLALLALVAGLVLLGASVFEAYQIRVLLPSPNNLSMEQVQAAVERGRLLPWAFVTGLVLAIGGGIGLISAVRKQVE